MAVPSRCQAQVSGLDGRDADEAATLTLVMKLHDAVDLGEERVIAAEADVDARLDFVPRWRTRIDPPVTN
jgi:hypothetical protein